VKKLETSRDNVFAVGDDFEVALDEPGGTGYRFHASFDESMVSLLNETHGVSRALADDCIARFIFRTCRPGCCRLEFRLIAPWDRSPVDATSFSVRITA
jgi:hypothetical protein